METTQTETNSLNSYTGSLFENLLDDGAADNPVNSVINSGGENMYATMAIYFFVVILVVAVLLFVRKYLMNKLGAIKNGSYMRIIDRISVSNDKHIILIEFSNKILAVGVTQQRIETLSEFDKENFSVISTSVGGGDKMPGFMGMLTDRMSNADAAKKENNPELINKSNNANENGKNE